MGSPCRHKSTGTGGSISLAVATKHLHKRQARGIKNSYKQRGREANHERLSNTENRLRVDGGAGERGKWVMGIEEGTCWDEHWVFYGSQFNNKLNYKKKRKRSSSYDKQNII